MDNRLGAVATDNRLGAADMGARLLATGNLRIPMVVRRLR
jgi:hypothetical protein